ncbi:CinA family protein [Asaia sp. VD9]|uniref:CinA family protein n=1 Tax=Asaia sp. VD9 TaxID=3081235 RepID=UPI003017A3BF
MADNAPNAADLTHKAVEVLALLRRRGEKLVTAESCTGGLISATLTALAGSSDVIEGGLVTYSNAMKITALGVSASTLERHGAVSEATATEMAVGALGCAEDANVSVAVTGIAGPSGGTADKPVGTVCLCLMRGISNPVLETAHFPGDRDAVRRATVARIFDLILTKL